MSGFGDSVCGVGLVSTLSSTLVSTTVFGFSVTTFGSAFAGSFISVTHP